MYLKKLEIIGFKSFAERTVLNFEQGMTAVVGPNGCGKSNIADAVRWVLGEQSAKALRGGSMQDVIFNGAESMKAMSMAEVSITLAECEEVLNTDYHEVTITRRVFRSGDSQYYMNKQACRLKDIHRQFMDTGIGRNSYSILEQGKIDQILSSRPEDRRIVFEEASGVTKFKSDRKEAMRKLDRVEQNLARLDDVIREVKRRMISLQRQAGKARRYQEIQGKLKGYELWLTKHELDTMQGGIGELEVKLSELDQGMQSQRAAIHSKEQMVEQARVELEKADKVIADVMERAVGLRNELNNVQQSIKVNHERIREMEAYASRDSKDAEEARNRLEVHRSNLKQVTEGLEGVREQRDQAGKVLQEHRDQLSQFETEAKELRVEVQTLRNQSHALEKKSSQAQQQLRDFDERERSRMVRQERLKEECQTLNEQFEVRGRRLAELKEGSEVHAKEAKNEQQLMDKIQQQRQDKGEALKQNRQTLNEVRQRSAGVKAKLDLLKAQEADREDFAKGARSLLGEDELAGVDRSKVFGALTEKFRAKRKAQTALESIFRTWLDAVVVEDEKTLHDVLEALEQGDHGEARIFAVDGDNLRPQIDGAAGTCLLEQVTVEKGFEQLAQRLLGHVFVVDHLSDVGQVPLGAIYVTPTGSILRWDGCGEVYAKDRESGNPLARQAAIAEAEELLAADSAEIEQLEAFVSAAQSEESQLEHTLREKREAIQKLHREQANREGELRSVSRDVEQTEKRLGQVQRQLKELLDAHGESDADREKMLQVIEQSRKEQDMLRARIEERALASDQIETRRNQANQAATEHRIRFAELEQQLTNQERQIKNTQERIAEFESTVAERTSGMSNYQQRVESLKKEIADAEARVQPLEAQLKEVNDSLESERESRKSKLAMVQEAEKELRVKRSEIESKQEVHGKIEVDIAERRVRYENTIQRITETYKISLQQVHKSEEPEWEEEEAPSWDALGVIVGEMKAKLEKMGPVNMVAIEEFQEAEDRYQFLIAQQEDLLQSKQHITDAIQGFNERTTELFTETFNKVNENFQQMFKQLFGGGEARLELQACEDILEAGIDIIAKPPGKKPQTISLLSGGERTMTAVALLFSLYLVKPSPFCVLDELDAALDDANIGRFIAMVQGFLDRSQFIVITHNQKTIAAADVLYGVTQHRKGISNIVSVKLTDHDKDPEEVARAKHLTGADA